MATRAQLGIATVSNASAMQGPAQMMEQADKLAAAINPTVPTASSLPASGNWPGRVIWVIDESAAYVCTNTTIGWITMLPRAYRAAVSSGAIDTNYVTKASFTLPAGSWNIHGQVNFDFSTGAAREYGVQLFNSTAAAAINTIAAGPNGTAQRLIIPFDEIVTLTATSTIQLRVRTFTVDGTQLILSTSRFLAHQVGSVS